MDIDRLLVVTFTNAAAAQMRERVSRALNDRLALDPGNEHLQRQTTLLYNAQITTIDSFCLFVLVLAMSYCTCAVAVFFRDLIQIINIGLQVGMWATPVLWDINMLSNDKVITLFKLNPLVYIVNGYRNAIYGDEWFFEHFYSSTYFWIFTVTLFCIGSLIFKRLKIHFADVL